METYQQCFLFILDKPDFEAFILLPEMYIREHSGLRTLLQQRNIFVLDEKNVSQCIPNGGESMNVEIVEIFMQDPPASSELWFFIPDRDPQDIRRLLIRFPRDLCEYLSVPIIESSRPAVDDSNVSLFRRILEHNPEMPIQIRLNIKMWKPRMHRCEARRDLFIPFDTNDVGSFFHLAVCRGHLSMARTLLELGLDVNRKSENKLSPLHMAIRGMSPAMVALLLEHGADPMCVHPPTGFTPLQECYDFEVTEILLLKAPDPDLAFQRAWTSFEVGPSWKFVGPLEAMLNYGAHVDNCVGGVSLLTRALLSDELCPLVIRYLLKRCYLNFDRLKKAVNWKKILPEDGDEYDPQYYFSGCRLDALFFHVFTVAALEDRLSDDICRRISESGHFINSDKFVCWRKEGVSKLKSSNLGDTAVSFFELLALDEHKIARLLRNESVAQIADSEVHDLKMRFPVYGSIVSIQLKKGKLRKLIQQEGIRCLGFVSSLFQSLCDELKEMIVAHLNLIDVVRLKEASIRPEIMDLA